MRLLLEQVGVEGEEAVQRVGVGGDTVARCRAADHRQHVAVVPLYDGVAEHHLVLPVTEKNTRTAVNNQQWKLSSLFWFASHNWVAVAVWFKTCTVRG